MVRTDTGEKTTDLEYPIECNHFKGYNVGLPTDSVILKETCVSCYDSQDSKTGVNLCLSCLTAQCVGDLDHYSRHYSLTKHGQYMNIRRSRVELSGNEENEGVKGIVSNNSLEFGGNDVGPRYTYTFKLGCVPCRYEEDSESTLLGKELTKIVRGKPDELSEGRKILWKSVLEECIHTKEKPEKGKQKMKSEPPFKCDDCALDSNLWLCLGCGHIGCGRKQYGISEGSGHALTHYEEKKHPLSAKVGTISKDGADIFCYACNEDRIDSHLKPRLEELGIDPDSLCKTEKSTLELNAEKNMSLDITAIDDEKSKTILEPLPNLIGIENLGNTCYLSSVLQILLCVPTFRHTFSYLPDTHKIGCEESRLDCLPCQIQRIVHGSTSGRYINKENLTSGLSPLYLLILYSKRYPNFQFDKQQDAFELLQMILNDLSNFHDLNISDFISSISSVISQRKTCLSCKNMSHVSHEHLLLTVDIPTSLPEGNPSEDQIKNELNKVVTLSECLDCTFSSHVYRAKCTHEGKEVDFVRTQHITRHPRYLIMSVNRFFVDNNGGIHKHNARILVPRIIDTAPYSSTPESSSDGDEADDYTPSIPASVLDHLTDMGFSREKITRAYERSNRSVDPGELAMLILSEDDCGDRPPGPKKKACERPAHRTPLEPNPAEQSTYRLKAFISHKGSQINSGHYTSHLFSGELNKWVTINDTRIYELGSHEKEAESGYIYLFEQSHPD